MSDEDESGGSQPIYKMTYTEIRAANIERNNQMLREIFGTDKVMLLPSTTRQQQQQTQQQVHQRKRQAMEEPAVAAPTPAVLHARRTEHLEKLTSQFPHRKLEIQRIWGYLDEDFCPAPALLVHGPPGSGKSDVSLQAVRATQMSYIRLLCTGFGTQKQLVRALWHEITHSCWSDKHARRQRPLDQVSSSHKAPCSFGDLVGSLRALLIASSSSAASAASSSVIPAPRARLCILLDNVDAADDVERGLSARLLALSELCHESIKVVATLRVLPRKPLACALLSFGAYSSGQIKDILLHRLGGAAASPQFSSVLNDVLPRMVACTNHVGELLELAALLDDLNRSQAPAGAGAGVAVGAGSVGRQLSAAAAVDRAHEQIHMPTLHMSEACLPQGKALAAKTGSKRSRDDASSSSSFSSASTPHTWARLTAVSEILDPGSLRGCTGCKDLPTSAKCLLVAAYLASHNRQEVDDIVFGGRQRGKRTKERAGTDNSATTEAHASRSFDLDRLLGQFSHVSLHSGIATLGGGERAALALGRSAGLPEPSSVRDEVEGYYGDARLFASVSDLEVQRYLVRGPGWTLERPVYLSAVPYKLASEAAMLLSFDLEAHRHH